MVILIELCGNRTPDPGPRSVALLLLLLLLLLLITARHDEHQISLVNLPFDLTTHPTAP